MFVKGSTVRKSHSAGRAPVGKTFIQRFDDIEISPNRIIIPSIKQRGYLITISDKLAILPSLRSYLSLIEPGSALLISCNSDLKTNALP